MVTVDSSLINADYAILYIYRPSGIGPLVSYDLHLGDTTLCRVVNKFKKAIKVRKDGLNTIWARTEIKVEIPIDIEFGRAYYIRCGVSMGAFVGHPKLDRVDDETGRLEYQTVKVNRANQRDIITMKDGRDKECLITNEDSENVFITIFQNDREIKTFIPRSKIESIKRRGN